MSANSTFVEESTHDPHANNCGVPFYGDPVGLLHPASFALYFFATAWLCVGIRVVSDDYFAVSIEGLIRVFKIPHSVAGATLMAIGASTPELMASFVGVFIASESATGSGTVIGSVIFNHLMIIGCCILVSPGQTMKMTFVEFSRDMLFYALAIALFVWFFIDGQVTATESWSLLGCYGAYILMCACWYKIEPYLFRLVGDPRGKIHFPGDTPQKLSRAPSIAVTRPSMEAGGTIRVPANVVAITRAPSGEFVRDPEAPPEAANKVLRHIHKPLFKTYTRPIKVLRNRLSSWNSSWRDASFWEAGHIEAPIEEEPANFKASEGTSVQQIPLETAAFRLASPPPLPAVNSANVSIQHSQFGPRMFSQYPQMVNAPSRSPPPPMPQYPHFGPQQAFAPPPGAYHVMGRGFGVEYPQQPNGFPPAPMQPMHPNGHFMIPTQPLYVTGRSLNEEALKSLAASSGRDKSSMEITRLQEAGLFVDPESALARASLEHEHERSQHGGGHGDHDEDDRVWRNPWEELKHVYSNEGWKRKVYFFIEFFWVVMVWITGGLLRQHKLYIPLFVIMLGWLILQCIYLTYWLEKCACTIGITPGAMGTILGAAGTSIPNLLCSMYVAKKGHGVMACTEVWGSQVWLIFVCLGLPWGIHSSMTGKPQEVQNSRALSIWMAVVYVVYFIQSMITNWSYNRWHGYMYVFAYLAFFAFVFANESLHFAD